MGLDVSHDCWSGAYSSFHRWRNLLAVAGGIGTRSVATDPKFPQYRIEQPDIPEEAYTPEALEGTWDECPEDPLYILLCHYDCDGIIQHEHTYALAKRLEELLPNMPTAGNGGHMPNPSSKTQQFIDGLYRARKACEDVEFY